MNELILTTILYNDNSDRRKTLQFSSDKYDGIEIYHPTLVTNNCDLTLEITDYNDKIQYIIPLHREFIVQNVPFFEKALQPGWRENKSNVVKIKPPPKIYDESDESRSIANYFKAIYDGNVDFIKTFDEARSQYLLASYFCNDWNVAKVRAALVSLASDEELFMIGHRDSMYRHAEDYDEIEKLLRKEKECRKNPSLREVEGNSTEVSSAQEQLKAYKTSTENDLKRYKNQIVEMFLKLNKARRALLNQEISKADNIVSGTENNNNSSFTTKIVSLEPSDGKNDSRNTIMFNTEIVNYVRHGYGYRSGSDPAMEGKAKKMSAVEVFNSGRDFGVKNILRTHFNELDSKSGVSWRYPDYLEYIKESMKTAKEWPPSWL